MNQIWMKGIIINFSIATNYPLNTLNCTDYP